MVMDMGGMLMGGMTMGGIAGRGGIGGMAIGNCTRPALVLFSVFPQRTARGVVSAEALGVGVVSSDLPE
jgi:hypothetical protein